jgi:Mce-associated membrane protein
MTARTAGQRLRADLNTALKRAAREAGVPVLEFTELHPDSAVVLVYVDQATTSKDRPDPALAASTVLVSMTRVNGNWLITKFDPV